MGTLGLSIMVSIRDVATTCFVAYLGIVSPRKGFWTRRHRQKKSATSVDAGWGYN